MTHLRTYLRGASPQILGGTRPVPKLGDEAAPLIGQQPTTPTETHTNEEFKKIEQSLKTVVEALQSSIFIPSYATADLPTVTPDFRVAYDTDTDELKVTNGVAWVAISTAYVHPNHSGDVTSVADGATTITNDAVTYAKMQNVSAASRLLGRGSASGAGNVEEITPGTGLSMSGTTLNVTITDTDTNHTFVGGNGGTGTVVAGATKYLMFSGLSATETEVYWPVPVACTALELSVVGTNPGVGQTAAYTLRDTNADTALVATIVNGTNVASATGAVALAAGARIAIKVTPSGGAVTQASPAFGLRLSIP